ncbi:MAG TPA: hypothetical protein VF384_16425, partial [Planctomycetota bacterium]
ACALHNKTQQATSRAARATEVQEQPTARLAPERPRRWMDGLMLPKKARRLVCLSTAAVALLALGGCVERSESDGTVVITFATWVRVAVVAVCPVALVAGLRLRRTWMKWKVVLVVLSLVGAAIVVPGVFSDRFEIDRKGFRSSTGFWFAPKVKDIRFADADTLWVPHAEVGNRHRTPIKVRLRSGATEMVPQGDLITQCLEDVAGFAKAAGVRVVRLN